jgi:hypothetical protein
MYVSDMNFTVLLSLVDQKNHIYVSFTSINPPILSVVVTQIVWMPGTWKFVVFE